MLYPQKVSEGLYWLCDCTKPLPFSWMLFQIGYYKLGPDYHYKRKGVKTPRTSFTIWQYTLSGGGILERDGLKYKVSTGEAMLLTGDESHHYYTDPEIGEWEFIYLDLTGLDALNYWKKIQRKSVVAQFSPDGQAVKLAQKLYDSSCKSTFPDIYENSSLAYEFAMAVTQELGGFEEKKSRLEQVIEQFCLKNIEDSTLRIDDLAKEVSLSKSHFSRQFHQITGITPMQYLSDLRIEKACALLSTFNLSTKEISRLCGFSDSGYFCKVFRKKMGMSPGKYIGH